MKKLFFLLFLLTISCTETTSLEKSELTSKESKEIVIKEFQTALDSANVKGSILIFDGLKFYSNDFDWAKTGQIPASTFKIPNSIIALELGIMESDSTMILWDGKPRIQKRWEQDLNFREAFHASCVPCYQEIARKVGVERMKKYTSDFNYGKMVLDSASLDMFWLEGPSKITQFGQISFLKTFKEKGLPISDRTHMLMSRMMILEETDEYTLRAKSGWSFQNEIDNCWFVGYVEVKGKFYYFATNIELSKDTNMDDVPTIRQGATMKALEVLGILSSK